MPAPTPAPRILRRPEVQHLTGLSRTALYDLAAAGRFPAPVKISARATGWDARLVAEWVEATLAGREWRAS